MVSSTDTENMKTNLLCKKFAFKIQLKLEQMFLFLMLLKRNLKTMLSFQFFL